MEMVFKVEGLDDALRAIQAAFPRDANQQRKILNQSMSGAARKSIIPIAKQLALQGDGSGALSEAIAPRAVSKSRALARGFAAIVEITPVRSNRTAMAKYIAYYYTARGRVAPARLVTSGIRHGSLIEFGHATRSGGGIGHVAAQPFLWPAAESGRAAYVRQFAASVRKKIESAVRRKARHRIRR